MENVEQSVEIFHTCSWRAALSAAARRLSAGGRPPGVPVPVKMLLANSARELLGDTEEDEESVETEKEHSALRADGIPEHRLYEIEARGLQSML